MAAQEEDSFTVLRVPARATTGVIAALQNFEAERRVPEFFKSVQKQGPHCRILLHRGPASDELMPLTSAVRKSLRDKGIADFDIEEVKLPVTLSRTRAGAAKIQERWPVSMQLRRTPRLDDEEVLLPLIQSLMSTCDAASTDACILYDHENGETLSASAPVKEAWPLCHPLMAAVAEYGATVSRSQRNKYLLGSVTAIALYEPCLMCSMALVHSRVKSLVFVLPNAHHRGAFNPTLHILRLGVNHRFGVFVYREGRLEAVE